MYTKYHRGTSGTTTHQFLQAMKKTKVLKKERDTCFFEMKKKIVMIIYDLYQLLKIQDNKVVMQAKYHSRLLALLTLKLK